MSACIFSLMLCLGVGSASSAQNTTQLLSIKEAVRLAQANSPTAVGADARVRGAAARLRGAGALPNPSLVLAEPFGKNTGGLDEGVFLSQLLELGDKRRQRIRAAMGEHDAARAQRTVTSYDLAFNAAAAYYDALRADVDRKLASDALTAAQAFAKTAETQFQAGDAPRRDVVRSKIELVRAEQALAATATDRLNRYATLRSLTGLPPDTPIELTDALSQAPVTFNPSDLQATAMRNRPEILAARRLRDAREAALHGARAQTQPDLVIEARRSTVDPTFGGNSLRIGVVFPLLDLGRNRADARAAQAALQEQAAALKEVERTVRLDVDTSYRTFLQAHQAVLSFQSGRLDRVNELLQMAQTGYSRRAVSYIELLDAQQVYRNEQAEYARTLAAYNIARAALLRALGEPIP